MTLLLFDTEAMDETAGMLRDGAGEYEVLSSQVRADADLGSMPPQTATWVADVIASISQSLNQLTSDLSSDAELLAWRSEEARAADDPSLGTLAEALFGAASAVGLSSVLANTTEGFASGVDPLGVPAGCAGCIGGYAAATFEPTAGEATDESSSVSGEDGYESSETSISSASGGGTFQTVYTDSADGTVTISGTGLHDGVSGGSVAVGPDSLTIGGAGAPDLGAYAYGDGALTIGESSLDFLTDPVPMSVPQGGGFLDFQGGSSTIPQDLNFPVVPGGISTAMRAQWDPQVVGFDEFGQSAAYPSGFIGSTAV